MLIDLRSKNITGKEAELALGKADITVNKNMVPFDDKSPFTTSGIRIGTAAITTRGISEKEIPQIVDWIDKAITHAQNDKKLNTIKKQVNELMETFPLFA
jgi:glycine hydroxymethyltransferase